MRFRLSFAVKRLYTNQFCIHHVILPALTEVTPLHRVSRVPPAPYACSASRKVSFLWFLADRYQYLSHCAAIAADVGDAINILHTFFLAAPAPGCGNTRISSVASLGFHFLWRKESGERNIGRRWKSRLRISARRAKSANSLLAAARRSDSALFCALLTGCVTALFQCDHPLFSQNEADT